MNSINVKLMVDTVYIREVEKEDVEDLIELYTLTGWKLDIEHANRMIEQFAKSNYSKILVADLNGKVVGKVTLDTVFPPYAEIVNLVVHPDYQGKGVGSRLVEECINRAVKTGYNVVYLMCDPLDQRIHKFYAKLGFLPGILGDLGGPRGDMWLYYFGEGSFVKKFLNDHPFAEFKVSRGKTNFHMVGFYSMRWTDPISNDSLEVFIRGQPGQPLEGGTMPRIGGVKLEFCQLSLDCWIVEENMDISMGSPGRFSLNLFNRSDKPLSVRLNTLSPMPRGISLSIKSPPDITIHPKENLTIEGEIMISEKFDASLKYLSLPTVISSLALRFS